jgi:hypothetical protein
MEDSEALPEKAATLFDQDAYLEEEPKKAEEAEEEEDDEEEELEDPATAWIREAVSDLEMQYLVLTWNDEEDDWDLKTSLDPDEVAAALSHMLFRMAINKIEWESEEL